MSLDLLRRGLGGFARVVVEVDGEQVFAALVALDPDAAHSRPAQELRAVPLRTPRHGV